MPFFDLKGHRILQYNMQRFDFRNPSEIPSRTPEFISVATVSPGTSSFALAFGAALLLSLNRVKAFEPSIRARWFPLESALEAAKESSERKNSFDSVL